MSQDPAIHSELSCSLHTGDVDNSDHLDENVGNVSPTQIAAHYVFLVHGYLGSDLEMAYTETALLNAIQNISEEYCDNVIIHRTRCNNGNSSDGIRMGGSRLAQEIQYFIMTHMLEAREEKRNGVRDVPHEEDEEEQHVTISFLGNSLGGMYSRFAISLLPTEFTISPPQETDDVENKKSSNKVMIYSNVFYTTATPHLGLASHTYVPIPRMAENFVGKVLKQTGRDLFRLNDGVEGEEDLIYSMGTDPVYLRPLSQFRKRVAYANAYGTDFQVPTNTAAFLSSKSRFIHIIDEKVVMRASEGDTNDVKDGSDTKQEEDEASSFVATILHTEPKLNMFHERLKSGSFTKSIIDADDPILTMSTNLDALGWTKIFVDARDKILAPSFHLPSFFRRRGSNQRDILDQFIRERRDSSVNCSSSFGEKKTNETAALATLPIVEVESHELVELMNTSERIQFPMGHAALIANSKNELESRLNAGGKPLVDRMAVDLIKTMFEYNNVEKLA